MATSDGTNQKAGQNEQHNKLLTFPSEPICRRCGGLMVQDFCTDLLNTTGEFDCSIARCVQCGDVVDPIIQRNRISSKPQARFER